MEFSIRNESFDRNGQKWIGIDATIQSDEPVKQKLTREAADPDDFFKPPNTFH